MFLSYFLHNQRKIRLLSLSPLHSKLVQESLLCIIVLSFIKVKQPWPIMSKQRGYRMTDFIWLFYFWAYIADDIPDDISLTNFLPHNFLLVSADFLCFLSGLSKDAKSIGLIIMHNVLSSKLFLHDYHTLQVFCM